MEPLPLISFITVNYNTTADTLEFLESSRHLTYKSIEIIVVDNASKENPEEVITSKYPEVKFIRSEKNLGFAGGNNLGVRIAQGKYLFFLNNDTILFPDFLEPIVEFMESHPDAGMASPKVLYPDGKTLQYVGAIGISPFTGRGKRFDAGKEDTGIHNENRPTDLGHGAAIIVPRKVIDEVGEMPEVYFLYYEEHDWCEQIKRAGYTMYYIADSKILHKESVSTGNESPLKIYYLTRNRLLFMRRNFTGLPFLLGYSHFFIASIPKNIFRYLAKRRMDLLRAFFRGVFWNLRHHRVT